MRATARRSRFNIRKKISAVTAAKAAAQSAAASAW